jgi:transposase-like protein
VSTNGWWTPMSDQDSELRVVRRSQDGRRRYDEKSKRALVEAALCPGVSVARLAQKHEINANLLRKWITKYLMEREKGISPTSQTDGADEGRQAASVEEIDGVPIDLCGPRKALVAPDSPCAFVPVVSATKALPQIIKTAKEGGLPARLRYLHDNRATRVAVRRALIGKQYGWQSSFLSCHTFDDQCVGGRGCDLLYGQQLPTWTCAMGNRRV